MSISVPHADAVDQNFIEAAKPLLLLGWTAPAAMAARSALEESLREILFHAGCNTHRLRGCAALVDALIAHKLLPKRVARRADRLAERLNRIARGKRVNMHKLVQLIESVETWISENRQSQSLN